jgi:signal transduction histidine kinase
MMQLRSLYPAHAARRAALMLILLHFALAWGIESWWARGMLLAHYGAFLLWQPFLGGERRLGLIPALAIFGIGGGLVLGASWWFMVLWLAALTGLVSGQAAGVASRRGRWLHLGALAYLLLLLLAWVAPHIFITGYSDDLVTPLLRYVLPVLPLALWFAPEERGADSAADLLYSLMIFLLVVVLILGSFSLVAATGNAYPLAVVKTIFAMAVVLMAIAWLWNPRLGFSGLGQVLSRYVLSIGLPMERWLSRMALAAESNSDPESFVEVVLNDLNELPWAQGVSWRSDRGGGKTGDITDHAFAFTHHGLELTWYGKKTFNAGFQLHVRMLSQILSWFYAAKLRELALRQNAYSQAIHETGARLTHDVKNLLQSMKSLVSAAENTPEDKSDALRGFLLRQLPQITRRLEGTLEKLKAPKLEEIDRQLARDWWKEAQSRHARRNVNWVTAALEEQLLPKGLFDSVLDNLLENALRKRQEQAEVEVTVVFAADRQGPTLQVCDNGTGVPPEIARRLLQEPVSSQSGLGIGLYQAARQAEQAGFRLELADNSEGSVCFSLYRK